RKQIGDGTEGAPNHIGVLTKLYGALQHDVRMHVGEIQTNIDPKRDQSKSLFVSKIFENQDFGYLRITVERPLRLNFAVTDQRITQFKYTDTFQSLALSRKRKDKNRIIKEELEGQEAQTAILEVLAGMKGSFAVGQLIKDRAVFRAQLAAAFAAAGITLGEKLGNALLAPGSLGERDPSAEICYDKTGDPEPDPELRDNENVPFPPGITLPLPLDYEGKKNKGKVDVYPLLALVTDHCEAYLAAEVLPYRPNAWIDHSKIKVGYEIPFNRHFYEYQSPRPLEEIEKDIETLEKEIIAMLKEAV
ncbi:MAG: DNA methyltransferase, partial [Burkholderiales bacterium 12-64-5]